MTEVMRLQEKYKKAIELGFSMSKIQMHLLNNDKDKVVVLDKDKKIVFFNDSFQFFYKKKSPNNQAPILGDKFSVKKLIDVWNTAINQAFQGEHSRFFDSFVIGNEITTDIVSISPLQNDSNNITGCVIFGKAITNDAHAPKKEMNLITEEPNLKKLYTGSPLAIITSLGYGMYSCNEEFENLTGYTNEEINSLGISTIFHPDEKQETLELMLRLHSGEFDSLNMRRRYIRKDGTELWASISLATIKDGNGDVISHIVLAKEISEEQKLEQAFQESEIRFKKLFDSSPIAILIREIGNQHYTQANQAAVELFGFSKKELAKSTRRDLMAINDEAEVNPLMEKLLNKEISNFKLEKKFKKKNGETFWGMVTRSIVNFGDKKYVIGIIEDTSQEKKMEFALKESEARMRTMFMGTADKFIAVDKNYKLIYFNDSAAKDLPPLFELEKLEEGVEMLAQKNKRLRKMWINHFDRALAGESFELEKKYPIGIKNRTDMVAFSPIKNPNGEIIGVTMIGKEITNIIKTQEALQISEARLKEAHQLAKLGNWEYDLKLKKFIGSQETQDIFKFPHETPPVNEKLIFDSIHPDDQKRLANHAAEVLRLHTNLDIQLKMNNIKNETLYLHATGKPYVENGEVVKVFGTLQDITKQKEIELNLFRASKEYIDLFSEMLDGVIIADNKGKIINANQAAETILGYSLKELKALNIPDIVHEDDKENSQKYLQLLSTQGYYEDYQGRAIKKNGDVTYIQVNSKAIYDDNKNMVGSRDILRDITKIKKEEEERKQLVKELEEVNNELKEFAYIVSHDLKAPLRHIKSISKWLKNDFSDNLSVDAFNQIALLENRVTRMHQFINGIFEYTKLGRIRQQHELINIDEIIDISLDLLNLPNHVKVIRKDEFPMILGEKIKIQQVFQNLISNGFKYNDKPNPEIMIEYKDLNTHHSFSISDNGVGIDKRNFEKIFQIFQTLQPKDSFESTGIGLTIVQRIVKQHGGKVNVQSKVGIGTTFDFTIEK